MGLFGFKKKKDNKYTVKRRILSGTGDALISCGKPSLATRLKRNDRGRAA